MPAIGLTLIALLALASNSIFCRLALEHAHIDPASFTLIRVASGAVLLAMLALPKHSLRPPRRSDWWPGIMLFAYMACFSYAYLSLQAGTGALILFGAVQVTMILHAIRKGERLTTSAWIGFALAITGLVWLVVPGLTAPDPVGALLMAGAGIAWGVYTLLGRSGGDPIVTTARNFALTVPMALLLSGLTIVSLKADAVGIALAVASGALTSGLGYVLWYSILPKLSVLRAAGLQLTVPVMTTLLGVLLLAEPVTLRLILASAAIISGVWMVMSRGQRHL